MSTSIYLVESAASRCYIPILRHMLEGMGLRVLTLDDPFAHRMESIMACIRQADAVLITGTPDPDMAVAVGAAFALHLPIVHLCVTEDITSANVAAAVSKHIYNTDDAAAELRTILSPDK